jgi:hypothetical protein
VDPRAGMDYAEKKKFLTLPRFEPDLSVVQAIASRSMDYVILAPCLRGRTYIN